MSTQDIRVLLVEDDEDDYIITRDLLAEITSARHTIDWVPEYHAALRTIEETPYDVYLFDYHLGEQTGLELLRESLRRKCNIPVILITGRGDREVDIEAMRSGATDYLVKESLSAAQLERSIRYSLERKRSEEMLQFTRFLFAHNPHPMWVYDLETLRFLEVNDTALSRYGWSREEFLRMKITDLCPPEMGGLCSAGSSLPERSPVQLSGEWTHRVKSGEEIIVEISSHLFEFAGRAAVLIVAQNITARKAAEEALRRSEEKFRTIFEETREIIFIMSGSGTFTDINPAGIALLGYPSRREMEQASTSGIRHFQPVEFGVFQRMLERQGSVKDFEMALDRCDGSILYVLVTASAIYDAHGGIESCRGIMHDITERKHLEQQLIQIQKMDSLGVLAGGIAHDFNNILTIILGHTSILANGMANTAGTSLEAIIKASQRGAGLVRQLLTFARKTDLVLEPLAVNDSIKEIVAFVQETFPRSITISTDLGENLPTVVGDPNQLHQIFINLSINARDAMPDGGTLAFTTGVSGRDAILKNVPHAPASEYVYVRVADTGVGMDEATRNRILEPFFTTKERGKGSGLGLAMVFGIVQNHHGFIDCISEPGSGAEFTLYFPVPGRFPEEANNLPHSPQVAGEGESILLVEDEGFLRSLLASALLQRGYTVISAGDGIEALALFTTHKNHISLILTDLDLPGLGGIELCKQAREINRDVRVILASGFLDPALRPELVKIGSPEFIQKPYLPGDVVRKVREVLDRKK